MSKPEETMTMKSPLSDSKWNPSSLCERIVNKSPGMSTLSLPQLLSISLQYPDKIFWLWDLGINCLWEVELQQQKVSHECKNLLAEVSYDSIIEIGRMLEKIYITLQD